MPQTIISLAGHPYSGKSQLTKNFEQRKGFTAIRPSDIIREQALLRGVNLEGEDRSKWADMRRVIGREQGEDWIAQQILTTNEKTVVVDGLRTVIDYKRLKQADTSEIAKVAFIGLFCPIESRFDHVNKGQTNKNRPRTLEDLFEQESPEYFSNEGESGIATQTVLDLTPHNLRIEYRHESAETIYQIAVNKLIRFGFIEE
jgi:cytidylate kinase